ncbi:17983_t:CDS:2, partial [Cetraspora pellucida]
MLLRNLDPVNRLCNETRLICREFQIQTINTEIATGDYQGKCVFISRISLLSSEDIGLPFVLKRKQFPPVFSHGQLYVTMSRVCKKSNLKVLVKNGSIK